jgi:hypothetical protein
LKGRILLQSPESGIFIELTDEEAKRATLRQVLMEFSPILTMLDESLSFVISELSFESPLRTTVLTFVAIGVLEQIREAMFGEVSSRLGSGGSARSNSEFVLQKAGQRALKTLFQRSGLSLFHDKLVISRTVPRHLAIVVGREEANHTHREGKQTPNRTEIKKQRKIDGKRIVHYLNKSKRRNRVR